MATIPASAESLAEITDTARQLAGASAPVVRIVDALLEIATGEHTADQTSFLFAIFGGFGVGGDADIPHLIALTLQRLGDPATNPGLRELTPRRAQASAPSPASTPHTTPTSHPATSSPRPPAQQTCTAPTPPTRSTDP
ncbi:hypothetical protein [Streptomyces sioyaensis]|uniref:hypothetical protein n=1 Tax=Streptomyces sioyaensis TaxID=67364 RepID=UPI0037BBA0D8